MAYGGLQNVSTKSNQLKYIPFRFVCHGLTTGSNYVFRVKAVNAAGYSQSSSISDAVVVVAAVGKCPSSHIIPPLFITLSYSVHALTCFTAFRETFK